MCYSGVFKFSNSLGRVSMEEAPDGTMVRTRVSVTQNVLFRIQRTWVQPRPG